MENHSKGWITLCPFSLTYVALEKKFVPKLLSFIITRSRFSFTKALFDVPCFHLPSNPEPPCHTEPTMLSGSQLYMDVSVTFLKVKAKHGMPSRLWPHQDLQFNCLFPSMSNLGSKHLWEEIWDFFSDNFSDSYSFLGKKSWNTDMSKIPKHVREMHWKSARLLVKEVNKKFANDNNQKYQWMHCPVADTPQEDVGQTQNLLGQHVAELQEAWTTHNMLAKAREEVLSVSHKKIHRVWLLRVWPWIMAPPLVTMWSWQAIQLNNVSVSSSDKWAYLLYLQQNVVWDLNESIHVKHLE